MSARNSTKKPARRTSARKSSTAAGAARKTAARKSPAKKAPARRSAGTARTAWESATLKAARAYRSAPSDETWNAFVSVVESQLEGAPAGQPEKR